MKIPLTQERLKDLLGYDPGTGIFTRVVKVSNFNEGDIAGCLRPDGYLQISVDDRRYLAHRLAFLYITGSFPEKDVDHINGIRTDNKWKNIRIVDKRGNARNTKIPITNNSGALGVCWATRESKWMASIKIDGKGRHLGYFNKFDDAVKARKEADVKYGFHENHGRNCNA